MGITKTSIGRLKEYVTITDTIGSRIELKKTGANFKANCPFHGEKSPSFVVSPSKQIYHCFGCGVSGDAIKFVQEFEKLDFQNAVEVIAKENNFTLEYDDNSNSNKNKSKEIEKAYKLFEALSVQSLRDEDISYLTGRGFSMETIKAFRLGYGSTNDKIIAMYAEHRLDKALLVELGLLGEYQGRLYSPFIKRITFPIRNTIGSIVGFAGRSLDENPKQKYINSKESYYFSKSNTLFNFDKARDVAKAKKWLIIVESQMCVMMCWQVGIQNIVASQGTALTLNHVKMIARLGVKVLLCYDGDKAGLEASTKGAILLSQNGVDGGVALLSDGKDPSDYIKESREGEFKELLRVGTQKRLIPFVLERIAIKTNLDDPFSKKDGVNEAKDFLASLDEVINVEYQPLINTLFETDIKIIKKISSRDDFLDGSVEDNIFYTLSMRSEYYQNVQDYLNMGMFANADYVAILSALMTSNDVKVAYENTYLSLKNLICYEKNVFHNACMQIRIRYLKKMFDNTDEIKEKIIYKNELSRIGIGG